MTEKKGWWRALVGHLRDLAENGDRAALAELRRALQRPPGEDPRVFRYVVPFLPDDLSPWEERAAFLVASLFAVHPDAGGTGSLGAAFATLASRTNAEAVERRFVALLAAGREDLPQQLRHAVTLLRAAGVPVNWEQLLEDLRWWDHPDDFVRRRWARDFWGRTREREEGAQENLVVDHNAAT